MNQAVDNSERWCNGDALPDTPWSTERVFIERPMQETDEQRRARIAKKLPAPLVSFVVGRARA